VKQAYIIYTGILMTDIMVWLENRYREDIFAIW